jgi:hypothetical protein
MKISQIPPVDMVLRPKEKTSPIKKTKALDVVLDQLEIVGGDAALFAAPVPVSKKAMAAMRKKRKKKPESEQTDPG